jgi:hypothetical protein
MSRRPLGASLSPAQRLVAYETWIRDAHAAIERLGDAFYMVDTGRDLDDKPISRERAWALLRAAGVDLQELRSRPFRTGH